jgi:S1-C subfamily serine protease
VPRSLLATGAVAACIALVVAAALALAGALDDNGSPPPPDASAQSSGDTGRAVDRVRPGMALVTASHGSSGSGFMIDSAGHILTTRRLVANRGSIVVRAEGANGPIRAEIVGSDPSTDIAVLKIPRDDARELQPLRLAADGDAIRVGEPVAAVGTPFGLGGTVTAGVVSALDQKAGRLPIDGTTRTDAATGPGNAGGPLVDASGTVVGLNLDGGDSNGYAVPSDTVRAVVDKIESDGTLHVPYLGMTTAPLTPGLAELLGLDVEHGLVVQSVAPGGPADRAGLVGASPGHPAGDVVTAIDREQVRVPRDANEAVSDRKPGQRVLIQLVRGHKQLRVRLTLGRY